MRPRRSNLGHIDGVSGKELTPGKSGGRSLGWRGKFLIWAAGGIVIAFQLLLMGKKGPLSTEARTRGPRGLRLLSPVVKALHTPDTDPVSGNEMTEQRGNARTTALGLAVLAACMTVGRLTLGRRTAAKKT